MGGPHEGALGGRTGLSEGLGLRCSLGRALCDDLLWAPGQGRGGGGLGVTHCGLLVCVLTLLSS